MFLGLPDPDPDPLIGGNGSGSASFYHQAKTVRKTLIPRYCLSLKNDANVASKSTGNKQKNFSNF
jgi:hypothetical protein